MRRLFQRSVIAAALAATISAAGVVAATPASAHPVSGGWSDNHTLCAASWCVRGGNVVRMWQAILWVDGFDNGQGTGFIDGNFGPNTDSQTRRYQTAFLGASQSDGEVGPRTWGAATRLCDDRISGSYIVYTYCGQPVGTRSMQVREHRTTHEWSFVNPRTGVWTGTSH